MNDINCVLFNWNVRGLNSVARRQVVKNLISDHRAPLFAFKKLNSPFVNDLVISEILGHQFIGNYAALPVAGTRGGVIIACSLQRYLMTDIQASQYSVSATIKRHADVFM